MSTRRIVFVILVVILPWILATWAAAEMLTT
jgi:hypothetical protein